MGIIDTVLNRIHDQKSNENMRQCKNSTNKHELFFSVFFLVLTIDRFFSKTTSKQLRRMHKHQLTVEALGGK